MIKVFGARMLCITLVAAAVIGRAPSALAQEKPAPEPAPSASPRPSGESEAFHVNPPGWVTQVFQPKFARPNDLVGVLRMFSGRASWERELKVVMWSGPKELAPAVEDVVKRLDVPPAPVASIELTFFLLAGSRQATSSAVLPAELESVAKQVKGIFGFAGLSLLETSVLLVRDGSGGRTDGVVPALGEPGHPATYHLDFGPAALTADERGKVVTLNRLALTLNVPFGDRSPQGALTNVNYNTSSLRTDAQVREGQKIVLGKASMDRSGDTLFLVVTAKVVE